MGNNFYQKPMDSYFQYQASDSPDQAATRQRYLDMYWMIDSTNCPETEAEKAVAKRKLLESMDAAMRSMS